MVNHTLPKKNGVHPPVNGAHSSVKKKWSSFHRPFAQPTFQTESAPLTISENNLKQAILTSNPKVMTSSLFWSLYYYFQDMIILSLLVYTRDSFVFSGTYGLGYILWVLLTGFFMWALFVVGHDCGHETFSNSFIINFIFGHLSHAPLLVPFYSWKLSHYYHHLYHNDIDRDTVWYPIPESMYKQTPLKFRYLRYSHLLLFLYPIYLFDDGPMSSGSHFNPNSRLFKTDFERKCGTFSVFTVFIFVIGYILLCGPISFIIYYIPCYFVFCFWLDLVTYLHHTHPEGKYYRKPSWSFFKGALTTIDRSYGWIVDILHHHINLHIAHHIFFNKIPHYRLKEATEIIKPILGEHYHYDDNSFWSSYFNAKKICRYVSDDGTILKYQP